MTGDSERRSVRGVGRRVGRVVFGDRIGLSIFLGTVVLGTLFVRSSVFISDTHAIVNAVAALADGQLHITEGVYTTYPHPGMYLQDGRVYGRNYGFVAVSVPFVLFWEAVAVVADLRAAVAAALSLTFLGFCHQVGIVLGRRRIATAIGCTGALGALAANLRFGAPYIDRYAVLLAIQTTSLLAGGLTATFAYRLLRHASSRTAGIAAGTAVGVATPVLFWSPIPKRHTVSAMCVVAAGYALFRAYDSPLAVTATDPGVRGDGGTASEGIRRFGALFGLPGGLGDRTLFRSAAYAVVAFQAWAHPADGFMLFAGVLAADFAGGGLRNTPPDRVVGTVFVVALVPMFVTNVLVSGNPLTPPRVLPDYHGVGATLAPAVDSMVQTSAGGPISVEGVNGTTTGATDSGGRVVASRSSFHVTSLVVSGADRVVGTFVSAFERIPKALDPERLWEVFVRGGHLPQIEDQSPASTLRFSFLEILPLTAATVGLARVGTKRAWNTVRTGSVRESFTRSLDSPVSVVDCFALSYTLVAVLLYLPRLPNHASLTVRYLTAVMPLVVYAVVRVRAVNHTLETAPRLLGFAYLGTVFVGGQLVVVGLTVLADGPAEAVQVHALTALALASLLAVWALAAEWGEEPRFPKAGAVLLGVTAGFTTVTLVMYHAEYLSIANDFILPLTEVFGEAIPIV